MANVIIPNYQLSGSADPFNAIWKLTRAVKKAGWLYKSSSNGFQKDTSGTAANDLWGGNADPAIDSYSGTSTTVNGSQSLPPAGGTLTVASAASFPSNGGTIQVATSANGWQTITYTGTTATTFTGCTGGTGTAPSGTLVGLAGMTFNTVSAWWNAQGPSTLKIPISASQISGADGYLIRGENVTQATTGAQGELLGYLFEPTLNTGYVVVMPRVDGSGADPHGWDHTHIITGSISGATVVPTGTVIEFVREIVLWKSTTQNTGAIYYQCVDGYSETTSRFSTLSLNANCTVSIAPGGNSVAGNQFPAAGSFVVGGTSGTGVPGTGNWGQSSTATNSVRSLIVAVSASYSLGVSADGSFTMAIGQPNANSGAFYGFMFTRVDSQEDGDVDPYVWFCPSNQLAYAPVRTTDTSTFSSTGVDYWNPNNLQTANVFKFWRRRGWGGTTDAFQNGVFGLLFIENGSNIFQTIHTMNYQDREKLANAYNDTYILEDVWCLSTQTFRKTRKGTCRWLKAVQGGGSCDLYGGKLWIQLADVVASTNVAGFGFVIGPWDGVTVQTQA